MIFTGDNITIDANWIGNTAANQSIYIAPGATGVFNITNNFVTDGLDLFQPAIDIASVLGTACLIENNRVLHNGLHGIFVRQPTCVITNNLVHGSGGYGIGVDADNVIMTNNTVEGNAWDGVRLIGAHIGALIQNNILASNGLFGILDSANTHEPAEGFNLFFGNSSGPCSNLDAGKCLNGVNGDIVGFDPLFAVPSDDNFHLSQLAAGQGSNSPAVDAGNDTAVNLSLDLLTTRTDNVPDSGTVDMGFHHPSELVVNSRSIGTNPGDLANTGTASVGIGGNVVTFTNPLPAPTAVGAVGPGDILTIDTGGSQEVLYVASQDTPTQVTVQWAATIDHSLGVSYFIKRAFSGVTAIQDWEAAREGFLVTEDRLEIGIAYNDGPFDEGNVFIDGSTTDPDHFMYLTVAPGQRHDGTAFSGANWTASSGNILEISDPYTIVEWFVFKEWGSGATLKRAVDASQTDVTVRNNIFYGGVTPHDTASAIFADRDRVLVYNNVVYNLTGATGGLGIQNGAMSDDSSFYNNTVYNCRIGFDFADTAIDGLVVNNIGVGNVTDYSGTFHANSSHNISSDATAPGSNPFPNRDVTDVALPGAPPQGNGWVIFNSLTVGFEDLHLVDNRTENDAQDGGIFFADTFDFDIDDELRPNGPSWDIGADEVQSTSAGFVNYRSIGTNTGVLASAGTASVGIGSNVVTFSSPLPAPTAVGAVGPGDEITIDTGVNQEVLFIVSLLSSTQVTVASPAAIDHGAGVSYSIRRAFSGASAIQDWEDARDGDLVSEDRLEVGITYKDGPFTTGATIQGSTTDANHFMALTVAPGQRHNGTATGGAGAGVILNGINANLVVQDDFTTVEWVVVKNSTASPAIAVEANSVKLSDVILYQNNYGIRIQGAGANSFTARNCIIHKSTSHGIRGDAADDSATIENCTLYSNSGHGIDGASSGFAVRNTASILNGGFDLINIPCGTRVNNMTQDSTACGVGSLSGVNFATQFVDIGSGPEDLHLAATSDAINMGTDLSASFQHDIDDETRGATWDIGADEFSGTALTLTDHDSGQVTDKFTTTTPVTDVLFRFKLVRSGVVTVDNIRVNFTNGSGVLDTDVTAGELWRDSDGDGIGDVLIQGGVIGASGQLAFTGLGESPSDAGTNYVIQATVSSLMGTDTTTMFLRTIDIDVVEGGVAENGSTSNVVHTQEFSTFYTLSDHDLTQVTDLFTTTASVTDTLFRFKTERTGSVTIDEIRLHFTTGSGVEDADVSGALWLDNDADGVGDFMLEGPVSAGGGQITFINDFVPSVIQNFVVVVTVNSLATGDTTTFSLDAADIDVLEGGAGVLGGTTVAVHTQDPSPDLTQIHYRWRNDDGGEGNPGVSVESASSASFGAVSTAAITRTVSAGPDRLLLVGLSYNNDNNEGVVSVVWKDGLGDEQSLTLVGAVESDDDARVEIYSLKAPNLGTADVRVTFDTVLLRGGVLGVVSFTGVDQTTPLGSFVSDFQQDGPTPVTLTVPSAAGELVFDTLACEDCGPLTVGGNQTEHWNDQDSNFSFGAGSTEPGAASVTMSWNLGTAPAHWAIGAVSIKPAPGSTGATFAAPEDTKLVGLPKNSIRRIRFEVSNEGAIGSGPVPYQLQVAETSNCSIGAYATVPAAPGNHWQILDSAFITDGEPTTNIVPGLTDEGVSFITGQVRDNGNTTGLINLDVDEFTEIEFVLRANPIATNGGDYCFRLIDSGTPSPLPVYSVFGEVSLAGGTLNLGDHDVGQIPDQFTTATPVTSELFAFKLTATGPVTVSDIRVHFTTDAGVTNSDVSAGELYRDSNNDGVINGGDFLVLGSVAPVGGVLDFNGLIETPGSIGTHYLVRATVANLVPGDTTRFSLDLPDIDEVEPGIIETGVASLAVHTQDSGSGGDVYYSVGTSRTTSTDLKNGLPTISINNGTATLSVAQVGNIGVGDEINYGAGTLAYIKSVLSQSQFVVHTANGGVPLNTGGDTVNSIMRAFGSLSNAESNSGTGSYLGTFDLTATGADARLTWVAYNDGPFSESLLVNGYTTDATHRITLTAAGPSQVASGVSQRHDGTANTGVTNDATAVGSHAIDIRDDYTTLEWFVIKGQAGAGWDHVYVDGGATPVTGVLVQSVISDGPSDDNFQARFDASVTFRNCIGMNGPDRGIVSSGAPGPIVSVENCTIYNSAGSGVTEIDGALSATNVLSVGNGLDFDGTIAGDYNTSTDGSAPGPNSITGVLAVDQFLDITPGSENLHLKPTADAINVGTNSLSGLFSHDIDDENRGVANWDIGADEAAAVGGCPQAFHYLGAPVDVTPTTTGSWVDVDVSAFVPAGATGVIVQWVGDPTTDYDYGIRMNGSTDIFGLQPVEANTQGFSMTGLDSSRIFEVHTESLTVKTYVVGYTMGGVTFFANAIQKTPALTASWEDIDISADTGVDTAIGAIFTVANTNSSTRQFGVRKKGSTDFRTNDMRPDHIVLSLIGVDANEVAQFYREDTGLELYLTGYVTSGAVFFTNAIDKSTSTTSSYVDVDISSDIGADDANGAILEIANASDLATALRRKGAPYDYYQAMSHSWGLTAIDQDDIFQQKIESTDADVFLTGYTLGCTGPGVNLRSIGTAPDYGSAATDGSGSGITATAGSPVVTGIGTQWLAFNRGRGDRIDINGTDYTILSVDSETRLTLTRPVIGSYSGGYTISRQFTKLPDWESCISGTGGCIYFPVSTGDLVGEDRREIGIAYDDTTFIDPLLFDGSTTDPDHDITLTVNPRNRHYGIEGQGVALNNGSSATDAISVQDDFVTVEWLEIFGGTGADGIDTANQSASNFLVLRNLLIHDIPGATAMHIQDAETNADIYNNFFYDASSHGILLMPLTTGTVRVMNNTVYSNGWGIRALGASTPNVLIQNNIAHSNPNNDFEANAPNPANSNNLSGDLTATVIGVGLDSIPLSGAGGVNFVDDAGPGIDLHITPSSAAKDVGVDLSSIFGSDIDGGQRASLWDIGADDLAATTAVELLTFTALGGDGAVELRWETGSEVDNVGFYLYRATSESGPYEPVNPNVIPGLGSSPLGASYRYVDSGLVNGTTYYYELEDLESNGVRERHGPVSATPEAGATFDTPPDEGEQDDSSSGEHTLTYGNPELTTLRVLKRSRRQVILELITGGFYAEPQEDGSVRLSIPGFLEDWEPGSPAIPVKRTWLQAVVGRQVQIRSVKAKNVESFSLRPTSAEMLETVMLPDGTVSLVSTAQLPGKAFRGQGLYPEYPAHVVTTAFQGDVKKAFLELSPLRWDRSTGQLLLARRLIVKVKFRGKVPGEKSLGRSRGRKRRNKNAGNGNVIANLVTHDSGLYGVSYRALFGNKRRGIKTKKLNLTYQGKPVAFYVHPNKKQFKPGSRLYFLSGGEELNPYGREAVYVLSLGGGGQKMERGSASPSGLQVGHYWKTLKLEENHLFQGRLTTAPDVWLWDFLLAPVTKAYPFEVQGLASTSESGSLKVWLQGTTNLPQNPDHHVRIYLNGLLLEDFTLEGELPWMGELSLLPGALLEGQNTLEIENVGDTGAAYSRIMLNRFEVTYPRQLVADSGQVRGSFTQSGVAEVAGFTGNPLLIDTTGSMPKWLSGAESLEGGLRGLRFRAEDGHHYLVADSTAVMTPEIRRPFPYRLKSMLYGANYVVIGPESLLQASWPLLELRISQGLTVLAVPIEQIYSEFGHGETRPDAIRDFLGYAYHNWRTPPRYVLLLGDGTFDFKDYFGWGVENQVPPFPIKSNYLWTASDPAYAAVNGDDLLPDIAIGRLPAANLEEAQAMVHKIVTYENEGGGLHGRAVLIADRPDPRAGDFEANAEELAATLLSGHDVEKIYLDELGTAATHDSILSTFDEGASLVSYIGHGAMNLWSENILRTDDVDSLDYPAHYPLLLTMNCLNGYFQFPTYDSLSETLLKADGKGIIAAFSPSGESLDAPAHFYHRLLLAELLHGGHATLGDAVLEAQSKFAESGGYLELLSIYHLFGDPAMRLREASTP